MLQTTMMTGSSLSCIKFIINRRGNTPLFVTFAHPSLPAETSLSLQSVIEVSDQHLEEQARRALRALSVFPAKPNTFSEEAALAVSAVSVEVLDTLSDAGLLEVDEAGRYTLHQAIADYARASLTDRDPSQRLVAYYQEYIKENQADFEALEQESHNIFTALETAHTLEDHVALVQGVFALTDFLLHRGLYALGKIYLQRTYEATVASGDTRGSVNDRTSDESSGMAMPGAFESGSTDAYPR